MSEPVRCAWCGSKDLQDPESAICEDCLIQINTDIELSEPSTEDVAYRDDNYDYADDDILDESDLSEEGA